MSLFICTPCDELTISFTFLFLYYERKCSEISQNIFRYFFKRLEVFKNFSFLFLTFSTHLRVSHIYGISPPNIYFLVSCDFVEISLKVIINKKIQKFLPSRFFNVRFEYFINPFEAKSDILFRLKCIFGFLYQLLDIFYKVHLLSDSEG